MYKTLELTLDTERTNNTKTNAQNFLVNTNDYESVKIIADIVQDKEQVDLTDATVKLAIRKPDQTIVFQDGTVTMPLEGECEFVLETQSYILKGTHVAEVMIYFLDGKIVVTRAFAYHVAEGILSDTAIESTSWYQDVNELQLAVQELQVEVDAFIATAVEETRAEITAVDTRLTSQLADIAKKTDSVVNILQFESYKVAVANGFDWRPAFSQAINSMLKGTVLLPPDTTFDIYGQIAVRNNIKILGHPTTVIKAMGDATFHAFVNFDNVEGGKNITFEGFTVDMNRQNRNNPHEDGTCGIRIYCPDDKRNQNIHIRNMIIKNSSHAGMYLFNLKNSKVEGNEVDDTLRDGIVVWFNSEKVDILDNIVTKCGDDCIAVNAEADGHVGTVPRKIKIRGGALSQSDTATYGNGIRVAGGVGVTVQGVHVHDTKGNGIVVEASYISATKAKRVTVQGNTLENTGSATNNTSGIVINGAERDCSVKNNEIHNAYQHGIYILADYVSATGNTITGGQAVGGCGIVLSGVGSSAKSNDLSDTPNIGIDMTNFDQAAIGNTLVDCCAQNASNPYIRVSANINYVHVTGNKLRKVSTNYGFYGVRVTTGTGDYLNISGNTVRGFTSGNGVSNAGTGTNSVIANNVA